MAAGSGRSEGASVPTSSAERLAAAPSAGSAAWQAPRGTWAWATIGLALVAGTAALIHTNALLAAATTWVRSPTYGYGMLVPPVVAVLLWQRRRAVRQVAPQPWPFGLVLLGTAALVATAGRAVSVLVVEQLAFVAILQAAALTILGPAVVRRIAFPLLYLYLAVPIGDGLIAPLQAFTAWFVAGLLDGLGVPVRLDGLLIHIPGATFHVAEACAGLRFLLASVALGVLLAELLFRDWWHRLAFVLAAIALPVLGNGLRAAGLVLIAYQSDLDLAIGVDHLTYGYVFTALLLAGLVGLAAMLGEARRFVDGAALPPVQVPRARIAATAAAALLVTTLPALAARPGGNACAVKDVALPEIDAPWTLVQGDAAWRPGAANPDAEIRQRYRSGDLSVDLYVGWYCAQREGAEAVTQNHRLTGERAWTVRGRGQVRLGDGARDWPAQRLDLRSGTRGRLAFVWYWVAGRFTANPLHAKLLQAKASLFGGPDAAAVVVASSPYGDDSMRAQTAIGQAIVALEPLDGLLRGFGGPAGAARTR
jgi:exosortase A